ncbi:MAG: aminotransferase class III-fold pyridoxal phosphate-dependent enzyme [Thermoanaerobaculia bacterium]|jgi:adenosylmethionine-8-amino-7-oxononanoate aminotransferase
MTPRYPDSKVFYRRLDRDFRLVTSAAGATIVDESGRSYLDASGGAMVANVGHGVEELADALAEAARLGFVSGAQFTHRYVEELAQELAEVLPENLQHSYFLASGSEAVEAAVKLARQYWVEKGREEKWKVISRVPSYHGNTLTALSLSGREHYRKIYGPLLSEFPRIPAPDTYRHPDSDASSGAVLEAAIQENDPETISAFIAEPIIGSSAGAMVPREDYYRRTQEICRRHDVLFIADEVLCGMGRTGRWFAFEHFGVIPDMLVLGKGLNGGLAPLSAVVAGRQIVDLLARGSGYFNHAQTYSHTPVICAAGLATIRYLKREGLVERCAAMEKPFFERLEALREFEVVGDVRGKGLLAGVEFVVDRTTKEPMPRSDRFAERVTSAAFENGLIVWPNVGHVDGIRGDLVMLAPPFAVTEKEIDIIVGLLEQTLEEVGK